LTHFPHFHCAWHVQITGVRPQSPRQRPRRSAAGSPSSSSSLTEYKDGIEGLTSFRPSIDDAFRIHSDLAGAMRLDSANCRKTREGSRLWYLKQLSLRYSSQLPYGACGLLLLRTNFRRTGCRAQQPWIRSKQTRSVSLQDPSLEAATVSDFTTANFQ
jgi:hypothetical protein